MWCNNCKNRYCWERHEKPSQFHPKNKSPFTFPGVPDIEAIHAHEAEMAKIYHPKYEGPSKPLGEFDDTGNY